MAFNSRKHSTFPGSRISVLFAAANPLDTERLEIDREHASIREAIERTQRRDSIEIKALFAATARSIRRELTSGGYDIVHISAHCTERGLALDTGDGRLDIVPLDALSDLFLNCVRPMGKLSCVILNACRTDRVAELNALHVPYTVAMAGPVYDRASIEFATGFYDGLAAGWDIERSYEEGRIAARMVDSDIPFVSVLRRGPECPPRAATETYKEEPEDRAPAVEVIEPPPSSNAEPRTGKTLHTLQRELYQYFDEIDLKKPVDLQTLEKQERRIISRKILRKLAGLGQPAGELLELDRLNLLFEARHLRDATGSIQQQLKTLHRKTAIYADHSIICIDQIRLHGQDSSWGRDQVLFDDQTLSLLLEHRPLIEAGKMSIVPEAVQSVSGGPIPMFAVEKLETVKADLSDLELRRFFIDDGQLLRPVGALTLKSPSTEGLPLEEVLRIEQEHLAAYCHFQVHLRATLASMNTEDDTSALKAALRQVDAAVLELDAKFETAKSDRWDKLPQALVAGTLAIALYAVDTELARFVAAAVAASSVSNLISFIPGGSKIPPEIRNSPYYVPWTIRQAAIAHARAHER